MNEETDARIRPLWLIGGGAAVVVLGACGLASICAAALLIWFATQASPETRPPTQAVVGQGLGQLPTAAVPEQPSPTPLPIISTAALASPVVVPTDDTSLRLPPDQAVRAYYQLVSLERYDLTWGLLSDAFKQKFNCCAPSYNYTDYVNWWNSVDRVEFGAVRTISQSGSTAVVYTELFYVMNTGARSGMDSDPYIELTYAPSLGAWQFNDKRASP